jgi:hypothetical protein
MFSLRKRLMTASMMAFLTWGACEREAPARSPAVMPSHPIHAGASIRPPVRPVTPSRPGGAINHPSMGGVRMGGMQGISHPASKPTRPSVRPTGITGNVPSPTSLRSTDNPPADDKKHHGQHDRHDRDRSRSGWFGWNVMGTGSVQGAPWWSQGSSYGGTPYGWVENYPYADYETQTKPTDIIREMSRSLESDKAARSVDDKPKREKQ